MTARLPSAAVMFRRLLHQRVRWSMRGHQKRTRLCPRKTLLAMLEDDEIDDDEEEVMASPPAASKAASSDVPTGSAAVGADDVAVMSKLAAPCWIYGKHPPKRTTGCFLIRPCSDFDLGVNASREGLIENCSV